MENLKNNVIQAIEEAKKEYNETHNKCGKINDIGFHDPENAGFDDGWLKALEFCQGLIKQNGEKIPSNSTDNFKEAIYELAYGDNAINRDFAENEVIQEMTKQSHDGVEMLEALEQLIKAYDSISHGIKNIAVQDYALLNDAPLSARNIIKKVKGN